MHTPCARAVVGRYSSHPPVLTLLLLVLLCCTAGCLATIPHHSMYGETSQKNRPTGVVREIPRRGQGAVQAYTTSAAIDSSDSKDNKNFEPIRIKAYTRDLNDPSKYCTRAGDYCDTPSYNRQYCHHSSVLTVRKRKILVEWSIPAAIKLHTDRLLVHRAEGIVKLRREDVRGQCGWYNIPEEHYTEGLGDADLHVYVSAAASDSYSREFTCQRLKNHRPIAVAINLEPTSVLATEHHIRTVAHEIAHGLGFDGTTFAHLKMISAVENDVRGKPHVFLVVSPKAKEVAQKYYNCSKAPGLELEDQGNSALSHFEMRNVRGELMSPKAPGGGSYSALTLAVFDDMPFYKANSLVRMCYLIVVPRLST
ncbi:leishmanolysin [Trypanosoma theileri]|uniref:Leishmanolysin-like peptidase n=1 Tax=Trypanosoma theileri TaxID=67003 RepID=A0A1X0P6E8_9TRYP|nr:leishmanolysin [Trypanosoma theileri]ORC92213.1 leishmanolysin [Trypanosoma theileri]